MRGLDKFHKYELRLRDVKPTYLCLKVENFGGLWEDLLLSYSFDSRKYGNSLEDLLSKHFCLGVDGEVCVVAKNIREHIINSLPRPLNIFWLDWIINHHIRCWKDE